MRKLSIILGGVLLGALIFLGTAQAADKLGYVDLSRLFSEYGKTKDYDKVLSSKQDAFQADIDKKAEEVKQLQDKINLLSDKEKEAKKTDLQTKTEALKEYSRQKGMDLRKEQDEKMKEILKDIEDTVKKYAEKEGFTLVFNDRVLVYQSKNMEITEKVLELLNKGYKK